MQVDSCIKMSTKAYGTKIKFLLASILGLQMEKDQIDQLVIKRNTSTSRNSKYQLIDMKVFC